MQGTRIDDDLRSNDLFQDPQLICDVVMKGGITSGVTYPWAVCEIAKTYRLRNIGGTSAGAIAAAGAAAAELGRASKLGGFGRLAELPGRISKRSPAGKSSVLFSLFQPNAGTARYFAILEVALRRKGQKVRQVLGIATAAVRAAPVASLVGAAAGLALIALTIRFDLRHPGLRHDAIVVSWLVLALISGLLLAVLGATIAVALRLVLRVQKDLLANRFGICKGFVRANLIEPAGEDAERRDGRLAPKPLTTWLADEFDTLAGRPVDGPPLLVSDLAAAQVNLKMFTTNLTEGSPYTLPFRTRSFYFDPDEMREYFPERVVEALIHGGTCAVPRMNAEELADHAEILRRRPSLLPLSDAEDMPVVVMTRMSLSFPVLLSAVPLWRRYTVDGVSDLRRCWFSDGGITSNFPIHFFDSPLPRWPTFGINLGPAGASGLDPDDEGKNVEFPPRFNASPRWTGIDGFVGFAHSILDTMQNWMDNSASSVPGYAERIVTILHSEDEGGMNLNMPAELIDRFAGRGRIAGRRLVQRFGQAASSIPNDDLSWPVHRWIRFRSSMPLVEEMHAQVLRGWRWPPAPATETYDRMVAVPPGFRWSQQQAAVVGRRVEELMALATTWTGAPDAPPPAGFVPAEWLSTISKLELSMDPDTGEPFSAGRPFLQGAPRPRPIIRVVKDF